MTLHGIPFPSVSRQLPRSGTPHGRER
jgi:hypothetical protein